jgi:hypothetical protein
MLLPPTETGVIQESGRKKNLNKVFFTTDIRSAKIYAGRSVSRFGGKPVIYRVIPMSKTEVINELHGSSVYCCDWGFIEEVK